MQPVFFPSGSRLVSLLFLTAVVFAGLGIPSVARSIELYRCTQDGRIEFRCQLPSLDEAISVVNASRCLRVARSI